jgi:hypothetical protein
MTAIGWPLVELASRLLDRDEREAVVGDLLEANESTCQALLNVFGLVLRRQALLWKQFSPWLAAFCVALPSSYLLTYVSLSVGCTYQRLVYHRFDPCWPTGHEGFLLLLCHIILLIAWSWAGGFVVGAVSRRTPWVGAAFCVFPCVFYLAAFPFEFLPKLCPFLFLLPAILGVRHRLRNPRISLNSAFLLAVTTTALMIFAWSSDALWILNWVLIWPVWYLVATARKSGQEGHTESWRMDDPTYTRMSER